MEGSRRDHATIDIDIAAIKNKMESSRQNMTVQNSMISTKCSIFKIPSILFRHDEKAYIPNAFSIGPLHHEKPYLNGDSEKIKLHYLNGLIARAPTETSLDKLFEAIAELEEEARKCYAVAVDFSVAEFIGMLVLDGCFIIELLLKFAGEVYGGTNDPIFSRSCMLECLFHDLILLENQIPWVVLECLFKMTTDKSNKYSLSDLVIKFLILRESDRWSTLSEDNHGSLHILDLLRNWLVKSSRQKRHEFDGEWEQIPSATRLAESGIKFKKGNSDNILDIEFLDGVLVIPHFVIAETTDSLIRNLISFEQCYPNCTAEITSYAILLDNLINTTKDLDVLGESEIIKSWLNPEEAITFFSKLYYDTLPRGFYYANLCKEVNRYRRRQFPRWRAILVRNHFSSPWGIISVLVAGSILVLTLLQTIFTIKKS